ncbi:type IV secretory system conjugative DNA transfer family protein [Halococcus sp. PRR34]|uniref:type IV secretory system conjugative DNA transfer family protein n=1 Tax=Halococcus sp. PRR34 TaxID=3020830 RepID=UPI00235F5363|nr:type IV secretory system conjugative DNA transfer family protein [Halococcus sp. PRR34]
MPDLLATLHKLWLDDAETPVKDFFGAFVPFHSTDPPQPSFELVIYSQGEDEPVEFYYGCDADLLDTLEERLRTLYPSTFEIERITTDLTRKLIHPVEYEVDEFRDRLDQGELYWDHSETGSAGSTVVGAKREAIEASEEGAGTATVDQSGTEDGEIPVDSDTDTASDGLDHPTSADGGTAQASATTDSPRVIRHETGFMTLDPPDAIPRHDSLSNLERPTLTQRGTVLARPPIDDDSVTPFGVRWDAYTPERKKDWMTSATTLSDWTTQRRTTDESDQETTEHEQTTAPNGEVIDYLVDAEEPTAAQFIFRPKPDWEDARIDRQIAIEDRKDTLGQRAAHLVTSAVEGVFDTGAPPEGVKQQRRHRREGHRTPNQSVPSGRRSSGPKEDTKDYRRLEQIKAVTTGKSYTTNIRTVGIQVDGAAGGEQSPFEAEAESEGRADASLEATLNGLCSALDLLDGEFYRMQGSRIEGEAEAKKALDRFTNREITTGRGKTRSDFVFTPNELASLFVVPSSENLSEKATRAVQAEQQSRSPVAGPRPELRPHYKEGMAVGDLPDTTGYTQPETMHLPATLMRTHWARFAATGSGKSTGLATDALSTAESTNGPEIVIEPKDGDVIQNFMRAYAAKYGFDALEEDVLYFPVPEVLPGVSVFDARQSLSEGARRTDVIQDLAERYVEIIKLRMGTDAFNDAKNAETVINYLIDALLDEEYGRENGRYRQSEDFFSHGQLQHVIDRVLEAIQVENTNALPKSSTDQTTRSLRRYLMDDPSTAKNILRGVATRADTISRDPHIRELFNNTTPNFDFREILETDKIVLFDLSGLRKNPSKSMAAVLLTMLYDALDDRNEWLNNRPDNYVVNLFVDEAHTVTVAETMNTLLEQGRGYRIGVGLYAQYAEQMRHEGGEQVYQNALNNIHTRIVGNIPVDDDLAEALATEESDPVAVKNRLRSMPPGEWFVRFPSPEFFESPPRPFTVQSRPIPPGHAEGDTPLSQEDEERFQETVARISAHTDAEYGAEETPVSILTEAPLGVIDLLDLGSRDMDRVLASLVQSAQMTTSRETPNKTVDVDEVLDELSDCYEMADGCSTDDMPGRDELVGIMERSRFLELETDFTDSTNASGSDSNLQVRLAETSASADTGMDDTGESPVSEETDEEPTNEEASGDKDTLPDEDEDKGEGEDESLGGDDSENENEDKSVETVIESETESKPAVGTNRTSGGEGHSKALKRIDAALHANGWTMKTVKQDSLDLPDARAYHPDMAQVAHVEAEHTTPEVPMKVIQNYLKAAEKNALCLAVVEERPDDPLHWAHRVENILSDPVKKHGDDGTVELYTNSDEEFEFPGGGHIDGTVRAVRRVTGEDDSRRSMWTRESIEDGDDEYVLRTSGGEEITRITASKIAEPRKSSFPAVYRYRRDSESGTYIVYEGAAEHTYDSKDAFTEEWVTVKQPFVPAIDLDEIPTPSEDYSIVVLPAEEGDDPYVFEDGSTAPLAALASDDIVPEAHTSTVGDEASDDASSQGSPSSSPESLTWEESKERFIEECLFTADDLESNPELEEAAIISNGDLVIPKDEAVDSFNMWQQEHLSEGQLPDKPKNTSRFTRDIINPYVDTLDIDTKTVRRKLDSETRSCYINIGLTKRGRNLSQ